MKAAEMLKEYGVAADIWSVTSYKELYRDAEACERRARLNPALEVDTPYLVQCLCEHDAPVVAATDYVKALPAIMGRWIPQEFRVLGTDGFGRSDGRAALRRFFEVDAASITLAAIEALYHSGDVTIDLFEDVLHDTGIDPDSPDPVTQ